jgi:hypothetical protein
MGQGIAQAFMQRDQLNRQKDLDAVNTGVGLQPMTQDEAQNPAPSGFMHTVRGAIASVQGKQNPDDVAYANNTMAQHPLQVGVTGNGTDPGTGFGAAQPQTPGAFNPMTGGFGPSIARYAKLPSGQTVDMAYTPFGENLQQAMMSHEYAMAISGQRIGAQRDIAAGHDATRVQTTGMNVDGRVQTTGMRDATSTANTTARIGASIRNHDTPSGSTVYSVQNRPSAGGANATAPLTHQGVFVNKQLSDTQGQINAIGKLPPLTRRATAADSSAYNTAKGRLPKLQQKADSLRGVLDNIGSQMGKPRADASGIPTDPADQYEYYRDQGLPHDDAVQAVMQGTAS